MKTFCTTCQTLTDRKSTGGCYECGNQNDYEAMNSNRSIEPQPDPVMTFQVLSYSEYPDNETEVIIKWFANGKSVLLGNLNARHAMNYRNLLVVPTDKTKGMRHGALHKYISDRPFLYDKNIEQ